MAIFKCSKCGYETKLKGNMKMHLNKKMACENQVIHVNAEIMDLINDDYGTTFIKDFVDNELIEALKDMSEEEKKTLFSKD